MGERMTSFPLDFSTFEVEITNRCNIKCPQCARTILIKQYPTLWKDRDLSLDDFVKFINPIVDKINTVQFKGANGDPIFHPKFIEWIAWCKENNKHVKIHTNGQAGKNLWNKLVSLLDNNDKVILGIDGLPNNFMEYRIGSTWNRIVTCVDILKNKCFLEWQYIVFSFNYDNIEEAKVLAKEMEFNNFNLITSNRQDESDWLNPPKEVIEQLNPRKVDQFELSDLHNITEIDPDCLRKPMHIISADGYYLPCCHFDDDRWRYKTPWARLFNIKECNINDVIHSDTSNDFFNKLETFDYCKVICGKCL